MNDAAADKYVEIFHDIIAHSKNDDDRKRNLRLLVKEVERDTRHLAFDILQKASCDISNLEHPLK